MWPSSGRGSRSPAHRDDRRRGTSVKVRIGVGTDGSGLDAAGLAALAGDMVDLGFDSLWVSEVLTAPGTDPLIGLAWAGAANPGLKLGTTMLLPGRNLVRLAKQVASLDMLSAGRLLVTFVPGIPRGAERSAVGIDPGARGAVMEESLPVLRRLWRGETVSHRGAAGELEGVVLSPLPVQDPFEVWLGGSAQAALERCGRLADGWLPAFCTPSEAAAGRQVVEASAHAAGRTISPEHFGVSIGYANEPPDDRLVAALQSRARGRTLDSLVPVGPVALRDLVSAFVAAGFSKFVLRPLARPVRWREELEQLAGAVGDLQT